MSLDRGEVLQHATELFWARGYEGATLEDLLNAMAAFYAKVVHGLGVPSGRLRVACGVVGGSMAAWDTLVK